MNLSSSEVKGLKSLRDRTKNGEIMVVPTDKSGRFAIMSWSTYMKAGEVHLEGDEEIGLDDLRTTQRQLNGHVSMLLKFFNCGSEWKHQQRLRESMLSDSLSVCPLWLLYKCHKGWTWKSGKPPPTRPVAGGNSGMNFPLSEIISWTLEPVASAMEGSAKFISC